MKMVDAYIRNKMKLRATALGISFEELEMLERYDKYWKMYKGFHWDGLEELNKAEVTFNKCRGFVDKAVANEFKGGFSIHMRNEASATVVPMLNDVWDNQNSRELICEELGQIKSVCGSVAVKVEFVESSVDTDPYGEFPDGLVKIRVFRPDFVTFKRDELNKNKITEVVYKFLTEDEETGTEYIYKEVYSKESYDIYHGDTKVETVPYADYMKGIMPWFEIPNLLLADGTFDYKSDLEDIIPLNIEYNLKASDISEIIDYHSAPITVVFGASMDEVDKGASKMWSGLPKDAKVQNLEMESDLASATKYLEHVKAEMFETANIPAIAFGDSVHISNTSGVALETVYAPLIELIDRKRRSLKSVFPEINKLILHHIYNNYTDLALGELDNKNKYYNEVNFETFLPKDTLVELNCIQLEMKMGLEDRKGAMKRLKKQDVDNRLVEIDADRTKYPDIYLGVDSGENNVQRGLGEGKRNKETEVNSGHTNSPEQK